MSDIDKMIVNSELYEKMQMFTSFDDFFRKVLLEENKNRFGSVYKQIQDYKGTIDTLTSDTPGGQFFTLILASIQDKELGTLLVSANACWAFTKTTKETKYPSEKFVDELSIPYWIVFIQNYFSMSLGPLPKTFKKTRVSLNNYIPHIPELLAGVFLKKENFLATNKAVYNWKRNWINPRYTWEHKFELEHKYRAEEEKCKKAATAPYRKAKEIIQIAWDEIHEETKCGDHISMHLNDNTLRGGTRKEQSVIDNLIDNAKTYIEKDNLSLKDFFVKYVVPTPELSKVTAKRIIHQPMNSIILDNESSYPLAFIVSCSTPEEARLLVKANVIYDFFANQANKDIADMDKWLHTNLEELYQLYISVAFKTFYTTYYTEVFEVDATIYTENDWRYIETCLAPTLDKLRGTTQWELDKMTILFNYPEMLLPTPTELELIQKQNSNCNIPIGDRPHILEQNIYEFTKARETIPADRVILADAWLIDNYAGYKSFKDVSEIMNRVIDKHWTKGGVFKCNNNFEYFNNLEYLREDIAKLEQTCQRLDLDNMFEGKWIKLCDGLGSTMDPDVTYQFHYKFHGYNTAYPWLRSDAVNNYGDKLSRIVYRYLDEDIAEEGNTRNYVIQFNLFTIAMQLAVREGYIRPLLPKQDLFWTGLREWQDVARGMPYYALIGLIDAFVTLMPEGMEVFKDSTIESYRDNKEIEASIPNIEKEFPKLKPEEQLPYIMKRLLWSSKVSLGNRDLEANRVYNDSWYY